MCVKPRGVRVHAASESPNGKAARFHSSTLFTARSVSRSMPTIDALAVRLSAERMESPVTVSWMSTRAVARRHDVRRRSI